MVEAEKKSCLLVLGGEIRDYELFARRLERAQQVFVADSGARHLTRLGLTPKRVYGDLDSLTAEEIRRFSESGCVFTVSPAEKNDTDGAIVLKEALREGYEEILIWGALGGRPDHSYANITLLRFPAYSGRGALPELVIEDKGIKVFIARKNAWIEGTAGDLLSLFALSGSVSGFRQKGLKYQPDGGVFYSFFPLGVSNEFTGDRVWMDWDSGDLLCMHIDKTYA